MLTVQPACNVTSSKYNRISMIQKTSKLAFGDYNNYDDFYSEEDDDAGAVCALGCDCSPLKIYVRSCSQSTCKVQDRYPSELPGAFSSSITVDEKGSTLFISNDPLNKRNGYCNPDEHKDTCVYYVAVSGEIASTPEASMDALFSITAATSGDVTLVTCDDDSSADGFRLSVVDSTPIATHQKMYEVCEVGDSTKVAESLIVTLEQCFGGTSLFACAERSSCRQFLPTTMNWAYRR
jgi:hypothetical protein